MDKNEFTKLLIEELQHSTNESVIDEMTSLEILALDSFSKLNLIIFIDSIYDIILSPMDLIGCETVMDIVNVVLKRKGEDTYV